MSKRAKAGQSTSVQLFPFLAVLLCAMGGLILLLVIITGKNREVGQVLGDIALQERVAMADRRNQAEWQVDFVEGARQRTTQQLAGHRAALAMQEDQARQLRDEIDELKRAALQMRQSAQSESIAASELERRLAQFDSATTIKEDELAKVRERLKHHEQDSFAVVPYEGPNSTLRRPIYIECVSDAVILQPEGIRLSEDDFVFSEGPNNPLAAALRAAREYLMKNRFVDGKDHGEPYPLLLVRPEGIGAYYAARHAMTSWGTEFGYELIDGDWKIAYRPVESGLALTMNRAVDDSRKRGLALAKAAPSLLDPEQRKLYRSAFSSGKIGGSGGGGTGDGLAGGSAGGRGGAPKGRGRFSEGFTGGGDSSGGSASGGGNGYGGGTGYGPGGGGNGSGDQAGNDSRNSDDPSTLPYRQIAAGGGTNSTQPFGKVGANGGTGGDQATGDASGNPAAGANSANGANSADGANSANGGARGAAGGGSASGNSSGSNAGATGSRGASGSSGSKSGGGGGGNGGGAAGSSVASQDSSSASAQIDQTNQSASVTVQPESLAKKRGQDWGVPEKMRNAVPLTRPVSLRLTANQVTILTETNNPTANKVMPLASRTEESVDELVKKIWDHVNSWNIAGPNMYWRPVLVVQVTPDGQKRFTELQALMADSGLEIKQKTIAAKPLPRRR